MKKNIAIIGFMGTGKTEVSKRLGRKLKRKYVSTDSLVEERAGKSIQEIFEGEGEKKFRELEREVIKEISGKDNLVIDCGGGVILDKRNVENLRENSVIICLTASPEVILERVKREEKRPLLDAPNKLEKIKEIMSARKELYQKAAHEMVDTSNLSIDEVVEKLLMVIEKNDRN